jgi:hypothetical protein
MKNLRILHAAKYLLIVAAILTAIIFPAEAKADLLLPEEISKNFYPNAFPLMTNRYIDDSLQQYSAIGNNCCDGTILAAAQAGAAKKKTPEKNISKKTDNNVSATVKAAYLMPMGDWKKLIDPGYGAMLEFCYNNLFQKGFKIGIETGYLYAPGKNDSVKKETVIPVLAAFGYRIPAGTNFTIVPKLAAGCGYFTLTYKPAGASEKTKSELESMAKGGLSITYDLSKTIALEAGAEYGIVFEKDGRLPFVLFQLGCSIGF